MFYPFAIAIVVGIMMLYVRFSGKDYPSLGLALLHGLFAVTGLLYYDHNGGRQSESHESFHGAAHPLLHCGIGWTYSLPWLSSSKTAITKISHTGSWYSRCHCLYLDACIGIWAG